MENINDHIEKLASGSASEKLDAVQQLGKCGNNTDDVTGALVNALGESNWAIRSNVAFALGELKCAKAIPNLLNSLSDENEKVRKSAVKSLGMIGADEAVKPLIKLLDDLSPQVRRSAARSLGQIGDALACKPLQDHMFDDVSYIRATIEEAMKLVCKLPESDQD